MPVETMARWYSNYEEYQRDSVRLSADGWKVIGVAQEHPPIGFRLFASVLRPAFHLVVTYQRG